MKMKTLLAVIAVAFLSIGNVWANNDPTNRLVQTSVRQGQSITLTLTTSTNAGKAFAWDSDVGDVITISFAAGATNGIVSISPDGLSMSYSNTVGAAQTWDAFTYIVTDGAGGYSTNRVEVRLTSVTGENPLTQSGNSLSTYSIPGYICMLENNLTLSNLGWTPVATNTVGVDGRVTFTVSSPNGFYRTTATAPQ